MGVVATSSARHVEPRARRRQAAHALAVAPARRRVLIAVVVAGVALVATEVMAVVVHHDQGAVREVGGAVAPGAVEVDGQPSPRPRMPRVEPTGRAWPAPA